MRVWLPCATFVEPCGAVSGVDLAAHPDRKGHLAAHESQTAVLQRQEPVGVHHRVQQPLDRGDQLRGDQSAAQNLARQVVHGGFQIIEIESYVFAQIGVGSRQVDLRHPQADGSPALLLRGTLLVGRRLHRGILRERDGDRFVERDGTSGLLCRSVCRRGQSCCRHGDLDADFHTVHSFTRQI